MKNLYFTFLTIFVVLLSNATLYAQGFSSYNEDDDIDVMYINEDDLTLEDGTTLTSLGTLKDYLKVGPNPFNDVIYIQSRFAKPLRYILRDADGNRIATERFEDDVKIDASLLDRGRYLLVVRAIGTPYVARYWLFKG